MGNRLLPLVAALFVQFAGLTPDFLLMTSTPVAAILQDTPVLGPPVTPVLSPPVPSGVSGLTPDFLLMTYTPVADILHQETPSFLFWDHLSHLSSDHQSRRRSLRFYVPCCTG
ncbi:Hypp6317 [Branchiostoma lanceolatum]|uniref:Hypp6317 protein n=1 Tax=Branchiostoma lanceolatum TaxID=7740 RepID=A0A8J9YSY6_BRALA|nr:Hypp6317 [Branchiostoma lanceolatum]